tara:strand:- start:796 stop:1116 length:321 start_codon:yes stop_codon:yes gene_type:complete
MAKQDKRKSNKTYRAESYTGDPGRVQTERERRVNVYNQLQGRNETNVGNRRYVKLPRPEDMYPGIDDDRACYLKAARAEYRASEEKRLRYEIKKRLAKYKASKKKK